MIRDFFRKICWWPVAKFHQWRINRYLNLRAHGYLHEAALKKARLSADTALRILSGILNQNLNSVGFIEYKGGKLSSNMDQDQLTLVLVSLADLTPVLPVEKKKEVTDIINKLIDHSWGFVRRAAATARSALNGGSDDLRSYGANACNQGGQVGG